MKITATLLVGLMTVCFNATLLAQSGECKIAYQRKDKVAATIDFPYTSDVVEGAIKDYMERKGIKSERQFFKSFAVYRNCRLKELDGDLCDIHCKVERRIQNNKETSVVYLLVARPGENIAQRKSDDRFKVNEAKELLNKIASSVDAYRVDLEVKQQEEVVKKTEKKLLNLKDDQYDLEKKIKALQDKLTQNQKDQMVQSDELNRQKDILTNINNKKAVVRN